MIWDIWKQGFDAWERATAQYMEKLLTNPGVLGPAGAVLYRASSMLADKWRARAARHTGEFVRFAGRAFFWLDWVPVRLSAASFGVVGDFEDAVYCWRTQAAAWPDPNLGIVLAAGAGALGVKLGMPLGEVEGLQARAELGLGEAADVPYLDSAVGLLWRALVLWVFVLGVLTLARVF